jgi:hypothetical protein
LKAPKAGLGLTGAPEASVDVIVVSLNCTDLPLQVIDTEAVGSDGAGGVVYVADSLTNCVVAAPFRML